MHLIPSWSRPLEEDAEEISFQHKAMKNGDVGSLKLEEVLFLCSS